ncbi:sodium-dependent bicarbonate transport family permease [Paenibacillus turpanensis]|uniref:sodium-dependent bicarbonate transport family permease n=1 Tax=Paenibacillus turpanensis TaxID=2689078 RepID=UPI001409B516|nr:sodium-dependent bicarbonate transport family permease [Paenibacillus turpanensis]
MNLIIEIATLNLLSPLILFFLIGIMATVVNSDLKVPEAFYTGYTMIILFTIGIKGGTQLKQGSFAAMVVTGIAALALCLLMLGLTYFLVKKVFRFSRPDALALAAHYGSVSAVTFVAGLTFLDKMKIEYESFMTAILVVMEGPAIISAIVLYKWLEHKGSGKQAAGLGHAVKEAFFGKSIFLLLGGIFIGLVANEEGLAKIKPLFGDLFYGILCIFLLHMGMIATQSIRQLRGYRIASFLFAFILPLVGGMLGIVVAAKVVGLSLGGAFILGLLTASASYIAAPAAIEDAIPEANPGIYIGSALGLTLPFNLIAGIPFYYWFAQVMQA